MVDMLQYLSDKIAIQDVIARYSIASDTGDAEGFAAVFTEDGVMKWEAAGKRFCGHDALKGLAEAVWKHCAGVQHAVSNPVIEIKGETASAVCQLTCFLSRPEKIYTLMVGYYRDQLVKINGKWLIACREVEVENPEILAQGKIGEYYQPLAEALEE